ncbi:hypothetical protein PoB_001279400 [Plakobranchus ocellatus]|uniref:Uncharacterized protein n=1 Tax=Plakobranchus ocellatus TaxID=259542 RepID=A0AAV3YX44_9GAST|nr:hypothetical protein PoB_001279400 [Plakobranchus ocellatus]
MKCCSMNFGIPSRRFCSQSIKGNVSFTSGRTVDYQLRGPRFDSQFISPLFPRSTKWVASPQQGDLRLSGPPSGQGAGSGARTRDRMVPADLRADSQATVLPTPQGNKYCKRVHSKVISGFQGLRQDIRIQAALGADSLSSVPPSPLDGTLKVIAL